MHMRARSLDVDLIDRQSALDKQAAIMVALELTLAERTEALEKKTTSMSTLEIKYERLEAEKAEALEEMALIEKEATVKIRRLETELSAARGGEEANITRHKSLILFINSLTMLFPPTA